ncbi:pepsin/retropepsin-like aspartic protease family protein [Pseudofrankia inefficax]|uniref:Uncharacterized protein n=1 Tax=Pseudofrankia inefficax (strain DSM 45817 / CECT 9037 / DDB 130130 / EuI1c) TaxID=298654 RepID=E3IZ03_PSEI1|nr:pepsin/retropepsin-like aspartic protease family protein [Pseudofrankia inefficax]ADP80286.1 hypothetical protein FraEuI1c_2247 [Pseudofrankia inefficax]
MENDQTPGVDRRGFLRRAGLATAAGAVLPLLATSGCAPAAAADSPAPSGDPDQLFKAGDFAGAERGYTQLLHNDPDNAHAAAQLGYIALLSNRFPSAERYLSQAFRLAPGDALSKLRLADCFVRQDKLARAVPLLPDATAAQLAAITGTPYEVHGAQVSRAPFLDVDPLPHLEASVNGKPGVFVLDTGALPLTVTTDAATEAGLRAVSSSTLTINGRTSTVQHGVAPSLRIGQLEVRQVPVSWTDQLATFPNGLVPTGTIGTQLFYHFLTTIDYKRRALILRQRTAAQQRAFRAEAASAGIRPQPLWLAGDHLPCTEGKLNDYGPRKAVIDTGVLAAGLNTSVANAQRAGITIDYDHPGQVNGGADVVYPITVNQMRIGDAVRRHLPGSAAGKMPWDGMTQFDTIGNFTHEFFKPFAVTFDYVGMNLFVG